MRENYYSKVTHWPVKDPSFLRFFRLPDFYEITIYISQTPRWNSGNPNIGRDPSVFGWTFYLLLKSSLFEPRKFDTSFPKLITSHSGHPKVAFWGVFLPVSLAETSSNEEISGTGMTQGAQPPKKVIPPKVEQLAPLKMLGLENIRSFPKLGFGNFSGGILLWNQGAVSKFLDCVGVNVVFTKTKSQGFLDFFSPPPSYIHRKKTTQLGGKPSPSSNNWGNKNWRCHWFKGKFGIKSSINPP